MSQTKKGKKLNSLLDWWKNWNQSLKTCPSIVCPSIQIRHYSKLLAATRDILVNLQDRTFLKFDMVRALAILSPYCKMWGYPCSEEQKSIHSRYSWFLFLGLCWKINLLITSFLWQKITEFTNAIQTFVKMVDGSMLLLFVSNKLKTLETSCYCDKCYNNINLCNKTNI